MDKNKVAEFISALFELEVNIHIAHLQTSSFSEHKALGELYEEISGLRDRFAEAYQGDYGIITGYKSFSIKEGINPYVYIDEQCEKIEEYRKTLDESPYLQAIIDDINELMYSVKYKLKFLK